MAYLTVSRRQVRRNMELALAHSVDCMNRAINATSEEEYNSILQEGIKAAKDYEVWHRAYHAMTPTAA